MARFVCWSSQDLPVTFRFRESNDISVAVIRSLLPLLTIGTRVVRTAHAVAAILKSG